MLLKFYLEIARLDYDIYLAAGDVFYLHKAIKTIDYVFFDNLFFNNLFFGNLFFGGDKDDFS